MKYWNSTCFLLSYACHGKVCINNYLTQPSLVHQYFCVEKWTNKASALHHKSNLKWFIKTTNCKFTNMFHFSISTTSWPWVFFDKYLNDLIFFLTPSHYNLQQNNEGILLSTPKHFTKATMGDWCFMAAAQQLCNSLPISIRSACTKRDFKQKLKTFLFSKAFC